MKYKENVLGNVLKVARFFAQLYLKVTSLPERRKNREVINQE